MACGSGSFLLGAYQCLMEHCLKWYIEHGPQKHKNEVYQDRRTEEWRLTIQEKKRILTTHIFGVDIDSQAVEVSKLSLLLKVLEGENDESVGETMRLWHERALPNLADNIKCGNSLIGPDYFSDYLIPDPDEMKRVNPFDWKSEFPEVFAGTAGVPTRSLSARAAQKAKNAGEDTRDPSEGGFDCVIGNPPYVRIQAMKEWAPLEVEIYKELYRSAEAGNYDIYVVFVEAALRRLNADGQVGFILPHKFFNAKYGKGLRGIISHGKHLSHVVHFGDQQIFVGATTYTCLLFLSKEPIKECRFVKADDLSAWRAGKTGLEGNINSESSI